MGSLLRIRFLKPPPAFVSANQPFTATVGITDDLGCDCYGVPQPLHLNIDVSSDWSTIHPLTLTRHWPGAAEDEDSEDLSVDGRSVPSTNSDPLVRRSDIQVLLAGKGGSGIPVGSNHPLSGSQWTLTITLNNSNAKLRHFFLIFRLESNKDGQFLPLISDAISVKTNGNARQNRKGKADTSLGQRSGYCRRKLGYSVEGEGVEGAPTVVAIAEDVKSGTAEIAFGGHVCNCAITLGYHMVHQDTLRGRDWWKGKKVVELGSGPGLNGITAALLGASAVLTDRKEVRRMMDINAKLNQSAIEAVGGSIDECELEWGTINAERVRNRIGGPVDVVVAADVLYNSGTHQVFLDAFEALSDSNTIGWIGYKNRWDSEDTFFRSLEGRRTQLVHTYRFGDTMIFELRLRP